MQDGFEYLESGQFAKAQVFFESILDQYPDNFTAQLCYGRAIGLNGDPQSANQIFQSMYDESPDNLEVQLNLAESILWNKEYQEALPYYQTLVENHPDNITALIGLANTYSLLDNNQTAQPYLIKALQLDPDNLSAMQSLQYVRLGLAQEAMQSGQLEGAEEILMSNLALPIDLTPTYLNLANLSININAYRQAASYYERVLDSSPDHLAARQGLTTVYHLLDMKKKRNASAEKEKSLLADDQTRDSISIHNNNTHYIQSLIWAHRYAQADQQIASTEENHLISSINALTLRARMQSQLQNPKKALSHYTAIIDQDSTHLESWIGRTQSLIALDSIEAALLTLRLALGKYPENKDLNALAEKLLRADLPVLSTDSYYNTDSGGDNAINGRVGAEIPISRAISILASYHQRTTYRDTFQVSKDHRYGLAGVQYRVRPLTHITLLGGYSGISEDPLSGKGIVSISVETKVNRQSIRAGYTNRYLDYNSNLLTQGFTQRRFFATYNVSNQRGLGLYSEINQSYLSDLNRSTSVFVSGYKSIKRRPYIKIGINLQGLTFREKKETTYFSPSRFVGVEIFTDLVRSLDLFRGAGITYLITTAVGVQSVDDATEPTYRLQAAIGYRFRSGVICNLYGVTSNIAANTVSGFRYQSIGLQVSTYLSQQRLFTRD